MFVIERKQFYNVWNEPYLGWATNLVYFKLLYKLDDKIAYFPRFVHSNLLFEKERKNGFRGVCSVCDFPVSLQATPINIEDSFMLLCPCGHQYSHVNIAY